MIFQSCSLAQEESVQPPAKLIDATEIIIPEANTHRIKSSSNAI